MAKDAAAYRNTLLTLWVALSAIAFYYASTHQNIPSHIAISFTIAALVETAFYLAPGFVWSRALIESIEPAPVRAFVLTITAVIPYLIYAIGTGTFHWSSFGLLALLATVLTSWFVVQPGKRSIADILFVVFVAAVILSKAFGHIYILLAKPIAAEILGHLMWVRLGIFAILTIREMGGIDFGFLPTAKDWLIGLLSFAAFMPAALFTASLVHFTAPHAPVGPWWMTLTIAARWMAAGLWVIALSEEFIFRGVLQQILAKHAGKIAGLFLASVLFGLVHLPFGNQFPNWRHVAMATVLGLFCGISYWRAGSVRASMVTHALAIASWKVFF